MKDFTQVGKFGIVGTSNTLLSFLVYGALVHCLHRFESGVSIAQLGGYGAGTVWSFVWNRRFTFRSSGNAAMEVRRFVLIHSALALASTLGISLCLNSLSCSPIAAWIIVMPGIIVTNFTLQRNWAFKTHVNPSLSEHHDHSSRHQGQYGTEQREYQSVTVTFGSAQQ